MPNDYSKEKAIQLIVKEILSRFSSGSGKDLTPKKLDMLKRSISKGLGLSGIIKNPDLLAAFPQDKLTKEIKDLLLKKPTKTLSGVTPVAVMIRPEGSCKWGCIYCPIADLAAKSYTGFEPAALRGRQYHFDPYLQASNRVRQFETGGHPSDKCEVIVMGGTFLETQPSYKSSFIKGIYDGLNGFVSGSLPEAISYNQTAIHHRVIGLTIETRPDVCVPYIEEMLSYGATRVELGVQHADDKIYRLINRGHNVNDVVRSTKALKDSAFKVLYHIMPGLPGSNPKKDLAFVKKLFADQKFRPDMLKIYPTLVIGGTVLSRMMENGEYEPYSSELAADLISEFYRYIPKYVRVMRIQRDIPATKIEKGVKKSNLRELVEAKIREKGIEPLEIRYREVGLNSFSRSSSSNLAEFDMQRLDYKASSGKEIFLSYENSHGLLAGFIRLRVPSEITRPEFASGVKGQCALIRELHIYGSEVPLENSESGISVQHRGLGSRLLKEAESIAREEFGISYMAIISGVGVREFYKKHGYSLSGYYMVKKLATSK